MDTTHGIKFTTADGETIDIAPGTVLVIGWSAERGKRGSGAVHATETVVDIAPDGTAVVLTGGRYKSGPTRTLALYRANGAPTSQIRGAYCARHDMFRPCYWCD